jgi:hypothetical protein
MNTNTATVAARQYKPYPAQGPHSSQTELRQHGKTGNQPGDAAGFIIGEVAVGDGSAIRLT